MDDHPPEWEGNGERHLVPHVAAVTPSTVRICPFLAFAHDSLARPVVPTALAKGLVENHSLTSIELHRCNLDASALATLAQALSVNKYITYLGLARNRFATKGGVLLAEALKVNQTLVTIDLSWNELRDEFAIALAEALTMNNSLQRLILDRNRIGSDGLGVLAHALSTNRKVRYLGLATNAITASGVGFLASSLESNRSNVVATLDLAGNGIATEGVFSLCSVLATMAPSQTLTTLNLSCNKVGASVVMVGAAVANCPALRELNLEYTLLRHGPELVEFAKALSRSRTLCSLAFGCNPALGDDGVDVLCEALSAVRSLKYLDLADTGLGLAGLGSVLKLVRNAAQQLTTLHVGDNGGLAAEGAGQTLAHIVGAAPALAFLGAPRCGLGARGVDALCSHLHRAPLPLTGLSLRGNKIGDAGFAQLLPFVLHHGRFSFLDLACNELTAFVQPRLPDIFQTNSDLAYIVLEDLTVVRPDNARDEWATLSGRTPPPSAHRPLPFHCDAALDVQTMFPPSAGFATYSLACGSTMRRQLEESANAVLGLLPYAGHPVKGCGIWQGAVLAATANLRGKNGVFAGTTDPAAIAAYESNIGGLLVSDDQLRREFNRLDVNGNGVLGLAEFREVYRTFEHFGVTPSEREVDRVWQRFGGGAGVITFDLFCVLMLKLVQH